MTKQLLAIRVTAAIIAVAGLVWLTANINTHGEELQRGLAGTVDRHPIAPVVVPQAPAQVPAVQQSNELQFDESSADLELVEMYQCMCGASSDDIRGWVGLWLVTVLVGGLPTAVLVHARTRS